MSFQYPSISNIQSNLEKASSFILQENTVNAMGCVALAASEFEVLTKNGLSKETQRLPSHLQDLKNQVAELYGKKLCTVYEAKPKALFPLRVIYKTEYGDRIELCGPEKAGLSWQQGKALICRDEKIWELDLETEGSFEYKLVLHKADGSIAWEKKDWNRMYCMAPVDLEPIFPIFYEGDPGFLLVDKV